MLGGAAVSHIYIAQYTAVQCCYALALIQFQLTKCLCTGDQRACQGSQFYKVYSVHVPHMIVNAHCGNWVLNDALQRVINNQPNNIE